MKNRFPDILPYDNSRVELPSTKDDYINASFIKVKRKTLFCNNQLLLTLQFYMKKKTSSLIEMNIEVLYVLRLQ